MKKKANGTAIFIGLAALIAVVFLLFTSMNTAPQEVTAPETAAQEATAAAAPADGEGVSETEEKDVPVIKVGMSGGYKPYTYLNEDGELTGFDVDVWTEIGNRIEADVEFVTSDFSGLFGMLDVGQLTTIANQITVTDARLEKYLFSDPYVYYGAQLIAHEDNTDIVDLESLKGKKVGVSLGSNYEEMVRAFDTEGEIEVVTYDSGSGSIQDVAIGRIDAVLNDKLALLTTINEAGLPLKLAGDPVEELFNAFPFVNNEESKALIEDVNQAISAMYEDGTMTVLSMKYFDIDITQR